MEEDEVFFVELSEATGANILAGRGVGTIVNDELLVADFDTDGLVGCPDVDALVAAIVDELHPRKFDLTGDGLVDSTDLDVWLALAGLENVPTHEAYLPGDANLDGIVDASDLNVVGLNWLQDVTGWCSGDFTADGVVNASDLNKVGLNWLQDVLDVAAPVQRVPRAPLANHVVAAIAAQPHESLVFIAASERNFSLGNVSVESETEHISSSHVAKRYVRRGLRSSPIDSPADNFDESQEIDREQLVDSVLRRW